jgi:hypothetical protein
MIGICVVLLAGLVTSFTYKIKNSNEVVITVTAGIPTAFDMLQNDKTLKGLSTPFEMRIPSSENKFIFKSKDAKSALKITIERGINTEIAADWPITVVLIDADKISSFGIN